MKFGLIIVLVLSKNRLRGHDYVITVEFTDFNAISATQKCPVI